MSLTASIFEADSIAAARSNSALTGYGERAINMIAELCDNVSALRVSPEIIEFTNNGAKCTVEARLRGKLLICTAQQFKVYYDYADKSVRWCRRFDFKSGLCVLDIGENEGPYNDAYDTLQVVVQDYIFDEMSSLYFTHALNGIDVEIDRGQIRLTWDDIRAKFNSAYVEDFMWYCDRF